MNTLDNIFERIWAVTVVLGIVMIAGLLLPVTLLVSVVKDTLSAE